MSYSLHIKSGDLSPSGPGGVAVVKGRQKLVQDLRHAMLEPRGSDPANPSYGSTLDGGMNPDGTLASTNIGESLGRARMASVEAEVRRVLTDHQRRQIERLHRENSRYGGKTTLTPDEMLHTISGVETTAIQDVLLVRCDLRTQSGRSISVIQPTGGG